MSEYEEKKAEVLSALAEYINADKNARHGQAMLLQHRQDLWAMLDRGDANISRQLSLVNTERQYQETLDTAVREMGTLVDQLSREFAELRNGLN